MAYEDFSPEIQSLILDQTSSSNPEAQQRIEQAYREKYGTAEIDSIPDPRAESKPNVKPAGYPERTEDYYKATFGFGDPDDSGAPKPPESTVTTPQLPAELPPEYVAQIQGFGVISMSRNTSITRKG